MPYTEQEIEEIIDNSILSWPTPPVPSEEERLAIWYPEAKKNSPDWDDLESIFNFK